MAVLLLGFMESSSFLKVFMHRWFLIFLLLIPVSCSTSSSEPEVVVRNYYPARRQLPPEPVYSRLTWSHLPNPISEESAINSPYLSRVISFELEQSNLEEAIDALAQSMGYEAIYSRTLAARPISISMEGTVFEVLNRICKQGKVIASINHDERAILVADAATKPRLPRL